MSLQDYSTTAAISRPTGNQNTFVTESALRSGGLGCLRLDHRCWEIMDDLYREIIIEHYKNPSYRGHLDPHDIQFEDNNPLCGDHIEITLQVGEEGIVKDARFDGHGCAISQASADLLVESIIGKPVEEVKQLNKEHILELLGIELGPVRLKCALLSLKVLKAGVYGLGEASDELVE